MPRNKGIGAKRKRKAVPSAPNEVTPDKEDDPEEKEPKKPEFDAEVVEEATGMAMQVMIEQMINIDEMVDIQMCRLHKREVTATGCRQAMERKFGRRGAWDWSKRKEREAWWSAFDSACDELADFQNEWGIPPCDEGCGKARAYCGHSHVCPCGEWHPRYAWFPEYQCILLRSPASAFIGE